MARVLLIEDDIDLVRCMCDALKHVGHETHCVLTLEDGLKALGQKFRIHVLEDVIRQHFGPI